MKAIWNNQVIAESENTIAIEGNHYFPPDSIKREFFSASETTTVCPWKGTASYYAVVVSGLENKDAAWYYPNASTKAKPIEAYVAFWNGVRLE